MLLVPLAGLNAQSKTGRCSCLRLGAPSIVSWSSRCLRISLASVLEWPSFVSASGTVLLTILITPPPTSHLYLTSAISGSMPVVSQSIMNAIVPVGAITDIWAFLNPNLSPRERASSQDLRAAFKSSAETPSEGILYACALCMSMTLRNGFSFTAYPLNGPSLLATREDAAYARPDIRADMAAA